MKDKLTTKQRLFVEAYNGNASEAALKAGYSKKTAPFIGSENLKKPQLAQAIADRQKVKIDKLIATREDRQRFWTSVYNDKNASMSDRLRASELLGKSEADFTEKVSHEGQVNIVQMGRVVKNGKPLDFKVGNAIGS
jgi:phage terminase small subunit